MKYRLEAFKAIAVVMQTNLFLTWAIKYRFIVRDNLAGAWPWAVSLVL